MASRGMLLGVLAYVLWGLSPIYWKLLDDVGAGDVVLHRILATALVLAVVVSLRRNWGRLITSARQPHVGRIALLTAALLAGNWVVFVWAVSSGRVVETSLGYFINPLLSVVLGVFILGESMRRVQWVAVGIATFGVVVLTFDLGALPWISLVLAGTFGLYGLLRKTSAVGSLDGLSLEVAVMAPFAGVFVLVRAWTGNGVVAASDPGLDLLLLGTGVVTAAPLLLFASAARRVDLTVIGLLQYIAPTIQFLLGVVVYNEDWRGAQIVGFVIIWSALAIFAVEGWTRSRRRGPVPAPPT